jgi:hypothetical protein
MDNTSFKNRTFSRGYGGISVNDEGCPVDLEKDEKYVWRLRVPRDCEEVLADINAKLGEYGRKYFWDRLVFEPLEEKPKAPVLEPNMDET